MALKESIRLPEEKVAVERRLARLEERFRHELMDEEERDRLRCRILKLKAAGR